jgi:hypothetical protein
MRKAFAESIYTVVPRYAPGNGSGMDRFGYYIVQIIVSILTNRRTSSHCILESMTPKPLPDKRIQLNNSTAGTVHKD